VLRADPLTNLSFLLTLKSAQYISAQNIGITAFGDLVTQVFYVYRCI